MMSATTLKNFSFFRLLNNIPLPYLYAFSDKVDEENEECCNEDVEEGVDEKINHQDQCLCSSLAEFLLIEEKPSLTSSKYQTFYKSSLTL